VKIKQLKINNDVIASPFNNK